MPRGRLPNGATSTDCICLSVDKSYTPTVLSPSLATSNCLPSGVAAKLQFPAVTGPTLYTGNYGCEPGTHLGFAEILRAADDVGMLISFSQPHCGHYEWKAADADQTNRNLLISGESKTDSDPVLEILTADVVRCMSTPPSARLTPRRCSTLNRVAWTCVARCSS